MKNIESWKKKERRKRKRKRKKKEEKEKEGASCHSLFCSLQQERRKRRSDEGKLSHVCFQDWNEKIVLVLYV